VHTQEFRCFLEVESLHGPLHWVLSSAKRFANSPPRTGRSEYSLARVQREPHSSGKHVCRGGGRVQRRVPFKRSALSVGAARSRDIQSKTSARHHPTSRPRNRFLRGNLPMSANPQSTQRGRRVSRARSREHKIPWTSGSGSLTQGEMVTATCVFSGRLTVAVASIVIARILIGVYR
jgi:hypothetical protein